jgi:chromosome segregation ATPase
MSFHEWSRRAILKIPRAMRFYEHTQGLAAAVEALQQQNAALLRELERTAAAANRATREQSEELAPEPERLTRLREDWELQLYVLRSDQQRSVALADEARTALAAAHAANAALQEKLEEAEARAAECERRRAELAREPRVVSG